MDAKLQAKVREIRETLGAHLQLINSLVDPIYDRKTWTPSMAADAFEAANIANTSASLMLTEIEHLKTEDGIKKDPVLLKKVKWMLVFVGEAFMSSARLVETAYLEPKNRAELDAGIGWALLYDDNISIASFKYYFGRGKEGAWALLRTVWSLLFFLPIALEVIPIKLGAVKTKAYYEDEVLRNKIYDEVHEIVETENAVVELYDDEGHLIDAWGPSEIRMGRSHAASRWEHKEQAPDLEKAMKLSREMTKQEYGIYQQFRKMKPPLNFEEAIAAIGAPGLYVEKGIGASKVAIKSSVYITKDKYFVSGNKRISRPLSRDEIIYVKDVMKNTPKATIEDIAQGLFLRVVALPQEYELKDIQHAFHAETLESRQAVPNISSEDKKVYNILLRWRRRY